MSKDNNSKKDAQLDSIEVKSIRESIKGFILSPTSDHDPTELLIKIDKIFCAYDSLMDENNSLWFILEEIKNSDIKNHKQLLESKINEVIALNVLRSRKLADA